MSKVLVRFRSSVPSQETEIEGALSMSVRRDEATDSYLGFMPSLRLYAQGNTVQEAERFMEMTVALYLKLAVETGELEKILLHRRFRRLPPAPRQGPEPAEMLRVITVRTVSSPKAADADESGMELEFAGA